MFREKKTLRERLTGKRKTFDKEVTEKYVIGFF